MPALLQPLLLEAAEHLRAIDARMARCDAEVSAHARADCAAQRLRQVLGIGPLASSALPATVANAGVFRNARQFAAWLGITPSQHSSGGKTRLGRSTRRGDAYLHTLLAWVLLARGESYDPNAWQRGSRSMRLAAAAA